MTIYNYDLLDKELKSGKVGVCMSSESARIIIPTACDEVVGFTNPDDLDVDLLARWKCGERGPEFENQKLMPGDCLVVYDNENDFNEVLRKYPDWHKTPEGIKNVIEKLYDYVDLGAKNTEPAIWNGDLHWAKGVKLITQDGRKIDEKLWQENAGKALNVLKFPMPVKQYFILLKPGDKLVSPEGRVQTAGIVSAIAVKQPSGGWNMVQLNPRGYKIDDLMTCRKKSNSKRKECSDNSR